MDTIRLEKHLTSSTLRLPELKRWIGKDVEIVVTKKPKKKRSGLRKKTDPRYPLRGTVLRYDDPCGPVFTDAEMEDEA